MNDGIDFMLSKNHAELIFIFLYLFDKKESPPCNLLYTIQSCLFAVGQIICNNDFMPGLQQRNTGMRSNIARAPCTKEWLP